MLTISGVQYPARNQNARFLGHSAPVRFSGLDAPKGKSVWLDKAFLSVSKPGPLAILPLEASVLVGRSIQAYRRGGWLELQERLPEELAAAVVWLFGVAFAQKQFEKYLNRRGNQHLSSHIAWNMPWRKPTDVDLTPQQMFAKNQTEINSLLRIKSIRWALSVGLALLTVAYLIPKTNQLKTNLILSYLGRRKRTSEGSNVQFGDPGNQNQQNGTTRPVPTQAVSAQRTFPANRFIPLSLLYSPNSWPNSWFTNRTLPSQNRNSTGSSTQTQPNANSSSISNLGANPYSSNKNPITGSGNPNPVATVRHGKSAVRFGESPLINAIQRGGALVEQTDFGQILAVDFGIAGGRAAVAAKRSPYETVEVLWRDLVSLYFYILCAPHLMSGLTAGLDKAFKTSSHLQPMVAELLHREIDERLKTQKLHEALYGAGVNVMQPEGPLREAMRAIHKNTFTDLLRMEMKAYLPGKTLPAEVTQAIHAYLPDESNTPGHIHDLLNAVEGGQGGFSSLSSADRQNLMMAIKQSARHTAGLKLPLNDFGSELRRDGSLFKALFEKMTNEREKEALLGRIKRTATLESMDQVHSMLRRTTNLARTTMGTGEDAGLIRRGEALADWVDNAVHHAQTLDELMQDELGNLGEQLHQLKLQGTPLQRVSQALGKSGGLSSVHDYKQALLNADTRQLRTLDKTLGELWQEPTKLEKWSPMKSHSSKIHDLQNKLEALNFKLSGSSSQRPIEAMKESIARFTQTVTENPKIGKPEKDLLNYYQREIHDIVLGQQGRFFSLSIKHDDAALSQKLREVLRGGLKSDSRVLSKALDTVGQLETDSRKMADTTHREAMSKEIARYLDTLYKRFNPANFRNLDQAELDRLYQVELKSFRQMNRVLHYASRSIAILVAMWGIGWLVPWVQNKISKLLTGQNENPGLKAAKEKVGSLDNQASKKPAATLSKPINTPPAMQPKPGVLPYAKSRISSNPTPTNPQHPIAPFVGKQDFY